MTLPRLPTSGEDIEPSRRRGKSAAARSTWRALVRTETPVINGMPVGNGEWGAAVEAAMGELDLEVLLRRPDGQRLVHGAGGAKRRTHLHHGVRLRKPME